MLFPLKSSNLASAEFDPAERDPQPLTITFQSGSVYRYDGVPIEDCEGLVSAPSPGRFFAASIKDSYSFTREG